MVFYAHNKFEFLVFVDQSIFVRLMIITKHDSD